MLASSCSIGGVSWGAFRCDVEAVRQDLVNDWAQEKAGGDDETDTGFYLAPDKA